MLEIVVSLEIISIILNTLFVAILWYNPKVTVIHKYYLTNLTIYNQIGSCLFLNWDILSKYFPAERPQWICIVQFYGIQIGLYSSMGTVVAMSRDKCVAVRRPLLYKSICTAQNTRITLCIVNISAIAFSLFPTQEFLGELSQDCNVIDLYPRRYGTIIVGIVLLIYLLSLVGVFAFLVISLVKIIMTHKTVTRQNNMAVVKAQRGTRIVLCSLVMYSTAITPCIAFLFWIGNRNVDLEYIVQHDFSTVALYSPIILSYIDPVVYFLCVVKFWKVKRIYPSSNTPNIQNQTTQTHENN